jgi:hypothetical protein
MAKKPKTSVPASVPVTQKTVDAKTDIDDIFAKPSTSTSQSSAGAGKQVEATPVVSKSKKKKSKPAAATDNPVEKREPSPPSTITKSKKRKSTNAETESSQPPKSADTMPEVAVFSDPSAAAIKKQKTEVSGKSGKNRDDEDERAFRDSRGDGPRESLTASNAMGFLCG